MKRKKISILLLCIILVFVGLGVWYVKDAYPVEDDVSLHMENVYEEVEKDHIAYIPENADTGIIFYPGAKVEFEAYAPLMQKLSKEGIACVLVHMPLNLAFFKTHKADSILEQYPQIQDWYVAGHSLGGASVSMCLEKDHGNYKGLILLASYSSKDLSDTGLRVLSIYGSKDGVLNRNNYDKYKENLPKDVKEVVIEGGNHAQFGNYGEQKKDGKATISKEEQQDITVSEIVKFIQEVNS